MGILKTISWIVFIIIICFLIYSGLYVYSLSKVEVIDVRVNNLQDVGLSGFTLGGEVDVYNGGVLKVDISQITYSLVLDGTGNTLASGLISGDEIPVKETVSFPFSNKINWIPTAELAWNLITPGKTYATLRGTVYVADLGFIDFKIPFEKKIDLEAYIRQFVKNKVEEAVENVTEAVTDTVEKIGEGIKTITGNIIKGIGKLFD
jgi:hypothetical protein